ncbi:hypothetical protein SMA90_34085, partial [Escherichia coli]
GIISSQTNTVSEQATVTYIPTITNASEIFELIQNAGYTPVLTDRDLDDPESKARQQAIREQLRLLRISLALTIPLFILQMGSEFG